METRNTTRSIAGHEVTLTKGVRYLASRPFAQRGRRTYPVAISPMKGQPSARGNVVDGMDYAAANRFLDAFNNGSMSFDGRVW